MKITLNHSRAITGHYVTLKAQAEGPNEFISGAAVYLDGFLLPPNSQQVWPQYLVAYDDSWQQVGTAGPGYPHFLAAYVWDQNGKQFVATASWVDNI
jgi:hypothetical protein